MQTCFILSYMIFAPLFGYLGDRYSRKWIMTLGVVLWSVTTLVGSFMNVSIAFYRSKLFVTTKIFGQGTVSC